MVQLPGERSRQTEQQSFKAGGRSALVWCAPVYPTFHLGASRQLGAHQPPRPQRPGDPALGPCGIVTLGAGSRSPNPKQTAQSPRPREARPRADVGETLQGLPVSQGYEKHWAASQGQGQRLLGLPWDTPRAYTGFPQPFRETRT